MNIKPRYTYNWQVEAWQGANKRLYQYNWSIGRWVRYTFNNFNQVVLFTEDSIAAL